MHLSGQVSTDLLRFAANLRELRSRSGMPSYRAIARAAHYSHTAISEAARGRELPSLAVTLAFVSACGGDVERWEGDWRRLSQEVQRQQAGMGMSVPGSPWPARPVADGIDPEEADCAQDAVTVHSRRIAFESRRTIVGHVELRYSGRVHAAWGRFEGYGLLDHLAMKGVDVQIVVDAVRERHHNTRTSYQCPYSFDYHWGEVVVTGHGLFYACAAVVIDGQRSAYGETDRFELA